MTGVLRHKKGHSLGKLTFYKTYFSLSGGRNHLVWVQSLLVGVLSQKVSESGGKRHGVDKK